MLVPKPVYLDGRPLEAQARTTREAAVVAVKAGARFSPASAWDRTQHVGEGPLGFYVVSRPGERSPL